jgi:predicted HAD superfamily phosphohydrolase YqeG
MLVTGAVEERAKHKQGVEIQPTCEWIHAIPEPGLFLALVSNGNRKRLQRLAKRI